MPEDKSKDNPKEVKSVPTTPVVEPVKKKGISPWVIVLIVALILIPCILCFVFMILPLILATTSVTSQLNTTSTALPILEDYYPSTSSEESLASSSTSSSDITYDGSTSVVSSSSSSRASVSSSVASSSVSSVASTTTSSSSSSVPFAVTAMSINVDSVDSPVKTCGQVHTFKFTGTITANGAGTVNYYWFRDDTGKYANESLTFTGAGSKAISKDVDVTSTGQYDPFTIQVQVFLTPNESQYSNVKLVRFHNICI